MVLTPNKSGRASPVSYGELKMYDKVEKVIDKLRPALGVNTIELVEVEDGVVKVRVFSSACHAGIPEATVVTLLEEELIDEIPEISQVVMVK